MTFQNLDILLDFLVFESQNNKSNNMTFSKAFRKPTGIKDAELTWVNPTLVLLRAVKEKKAKTIKMLIASQQHTM